jgi:hypothetical protein
MEQATGILQHDAWAEAFPHQARGDAGGADGQRAVGQGRDRLRYIFRKREAPEDLVFV